MFFDNNIPIYLQVVEDIKRKIITGELNTGDKMVSQRDLALEYKINPNTSVRVYKELEMQGICETRRGLGTFVVEDKAMVTRIKEEVTKEIVDTYVNSMKQLNVSKAEATAFVLNSKDW